MMDSNTGCSDFGAKFIAGEWFLTASPKRQRQLRRNGVSATSSVSNPTSRDRVRSISTTAQFDNGRRFCVAGAAMSKLHKPQYGKLGPVDIQNRSGNSQCC